MAFKSARESYQNQTEIDMCASFIVRGIVLAKEAIAAMLEEE